MTDASQTTRGAAVALDNECVLTDEPLTEILDELDAHCDGKDDTSLGEIVEGFDRRGFAPMLLVPALIALGPTGMIPGMSIATGTIIILIAAQMLAGRRSPWLPGRARQFSCSTAKLRKLVIKSRGTASFLDRTLKERWPFFTEGITARLGAVYCIAMAATFYPLALVPLGVALPSAAIIIFSIGLASKDGLVVLASNAFGLAALGLTGWFLISLI